MHESHLARQILDQVLTRATSERAARVVAVRGWLADPERLDPQSLAFHFAAHARGTCAEGAQLALSISAIGARCNACGQEFDTDEHVPVCTNCGSADCEWRSPPGFGIDEMDVA